MNIESFKKIILLKGILFQVIFIRIECFEARHQ